MKLSKRMKSIFFIGTVTYWIGGILVNIEHGASLTLTYVIYLFAIGFTMLIAKAAEDMDV